MRNGVGGTKKARPSRSTAAKRKNKQVIDESIRLHHVFLLFSGVSLALTTIYWSLLGALINQQNADQLVDPQLFANPATFHDAQFPLAHTQLLKWPLFLLIQLAGGTPTAFYAATILFSVATVGGLAYILYRIEKRPYMLGSLYLALASVLLLVPIEPYPGALLPVSMAMVATRNIEYVIYIAALALSIRSRQLFDKRLVLATLLLALLFSSDQLFIGLGIVGSALTLGLGMLARQKRLVRKTLYALGASIAASFVAYVLITAITAFGITHIVGSGVGPYGASIVVKDKLLAIIYAILGVLTNFGANPVYDVTIAKDVMRELPRRLLSIGIVSYVMNIAIFVAVILAYVRLLGAFIKRPRNQRDTPRSETALLLSISLLASSVVTVALFVATSHYYAVDARYLTIVLFAGFVALATYGSTKQLRSLPPFMAVTLFVSVVVGIFVAQQGFTSSSTALSSTSTQDTKIAAALKQHHVDTIIGDYWRVVPIANIEPSVTPLPLGTCMDARNILASKQWQKGAYERSFAYVYSNQQSVTGFPGCSLQKIVTAFGPPTDSVVIDGSVQKPAVSILFYDHGKVKPSKKAVAKAATNNLVRSFGDLNDGACKKRTVMQIVAHQDDDLLFMNPDLSHSIANGDCIRSVYVTSGDGGNDQLYWLGREEGSKHAYEQMLHIQNPHWYSRTVELSPKIFVTVTKLREQNMRVSLIFLRLPDGNTTGSGFGSHNNESIQRLWNGSIPAMHSVDGQSTYTKDELIDSLQKVMDNYHPAEIRTQTPHNFSNKFHDHSDHLTVGAMVQTVYQRYHASHQDSTMSYYIGYPVSDRPENVAGDDLALKQQTFFTYTTKDPSTCSSVSECKGTAYERYLGRQYLDTTEPSS